MVLSRSFARLFAIGLLAAQPTLASSPIAEVLCEPTNRLHEKLTIRMGGEKTATGMRSPQQIMEVWTNPNGGWTLVMTYATGTSCIVAMGDDWTPIPSKEPA